MARISGIDLPREKRIEIALQYIYGIGPATAKKLLERTGIIAGPSRQRHDAKTTRRRSATRSISFSFASKAICVAKFRATSSA